MTEKHGKSGPLAAYFVPVGIAEKEGGKIKCHDGKQMGVHVMDARTRGDVLNEWIGGDLASLYKSYAMTILLGLAAIGAFLWVHWAVAAALAYAAGYNYSRYLFMYAWSIQWYKGKSILYTE